MTDNDNELFRNADRRREARIGAKVAVKFNATADAARAFSTFSVNFSAGGLCLRTRTPHGVGDHLELSITIGAQLFQLKGVVAWVKADVIGIRFEGVSPADRDRLEVVARALATSNPAVR